MSCDEIFDSIRKNKEDYRTQMSCGCCKKREIELLYFTENEGWYAETFLDNECHNAPVDMENLWRVRASELKEAGAKCYQSQTQSDCISFGINTYGEKRLCKSYDM